MCMIHIQEQKGSQPQRPPQRNVKLLVENMEKLVDRNLNP